MKITHEKYPVLEKLERGILGHIGMTQNDWELWGRLGLLGPFRDSFKENIPWFKQSIRYISSTLSNAIDEARPKLGKPELLMGIGTCSGTLLYNDLQYCYRIESAPGTDEWDYIFYAFKGSHFVGVSMSERFNPVEALSGKTLRWFSEQFAQPHQFDEGAQGLSSQIMLILAFILFVEIETKVVRHGSPIFDGVNCLYNNKTKYPIEIIDSTWFTTLVNSNEFKVRGHLRWQPCGDGLKARKLIWIDEFKKHGYIRQARKFVQ